MPPDDDVMAGVKRHCEAVFGLRPLNIDAPDRMTFMCGVFKCFQSNIGVFLRFEYQEPKTELSLAVKASSGIAVDVMSRFVRNASAV